MRDVMYNKFISQRLYYTSQVLNNTNQYQYKMWPELYVRRIGTVFMTWNAWLAVKYLWTKFANMRGNVGIVNLMCI